MWRLSRARSGTPEMAVGSVSRSFAAKGSPSVAATAALVTRGNAAGVTPTSTVKLTESPGGIAA